MKTLEEIKKDYVSETIDGRDLDRLVDFIPESELESFGIELKEEYKGKHKHITLNRKNILRRLKRDIAFGFGKALNQRGISAGLMWDVISMWNWILEEGLENFSENNYAEYGLPLLKATALKYDFNNPIGKDKGNEYKYSMEAN